MRWKPEMLQQLLRMEIDNEYICARAEKFSYFLPKGFLQSAMQCGEEILKLKTEVERGNFIRATNSQVQ